jgi:hypothetical protein
MDKECQRIMKYGFLLLLFLIFFVYLAKKTRQKDLVLRRV